MKKLIFVASLLFTTAVQAQESILVTPQWLNEHKTDKDLVIVQPSYLQFEYDREHIQGARFIWPPSLSPDSPQGSMNAPDVKVAAELLGSLGISNDSHVLICHLRNEVSQSARLFLVLEQLGLKGKVLFLNGGLEAWKKAGYPVTAELPIVKKVKFTPQVTALLVDKDYVKARLHADGSVIVDARAKNYYDGDPVGNPRDGHITGAKNIPYAEMLDANTFGFKPSDQLKAYFQPVASPDKEVVLLPTRKWSPIVSLVRLPAWYTWLVGFSDTI